MMLYKNTKAMVHLPNDNTDFFNIVVGVLHGNTFAPYLFIICPDYALWMSINLIKEKHIHIKKDNKQMISHRIYDSAEYADDVMLFTDMPSQVKFLLQRLASTWMQIKQSSCVLNKKVISFWN